MRIDHFRGFDEYYSIPYGDPTAENGHWEKGPGMDLFHKIKPVSYTHLAVYKRQVSMQGLGYKEILDYLDGVCTLEDAIYKIKRDTRHFAKRQITWFKREKHVTWINKKDYNYDEEKILEVMLESIKKDILEEQSC